MKLYAALWLVILLGASFQARAGEAPDCRLSRTQAEDLIFALDDLDVFARAATSSGMEFARVMTLPESPWFTSPDAARRTYHEDLRIYDKKRMELRKGLQAIVRTCSQEAEK